MEDNLIRAKGLRLILTICLGVYLARYSEATKLTDVFAVEIVGDPAVANSIAAKYGFKVLSHVSINEFCPFLVLKVHAKLDELLNCSFKSIVTYNSYIYL